MASRGPELRFGAVFRGARGISGLFSPRSESKDGIRREYDIAVPMRDGKKIYVDIFRPEAPGRYPALIAWGPYGKHGVTKYAYFPRCGVADADLSENTIFEGPQPGYWCPNGYVIINVDLVAPGIRRVISPS